MAQDPDGNSNGSTQHPCHQEDRLEALEEDSVKAKVELTEQRLGLKYLGESVEKGFVTLGNRIEQCVAPVAQQIHEYGQRFEAMSERLGEQGRLLEGITASRKRTRDRWSGVGKALLGILIAGAGVGIKEFVVYLVHHPR